MSSKIFEAFGRNSAKVAVHYIRSESEATEVFSKIKSFGSESFLVQGDLSKPEACIDIVNRTIKYFGSIDVVINNAGGLIERKLVEDISIELFDNVINLN